MSSIGDEIARRLKLFRDRLVSGESFERVTIVRCKCPRCGEDFLHASKERIDPSRVMIQKNEGPQ